MACYTPQIWPDRNQLRCLVMSLLALIFAYMLCLFFAVHNIYKYIYRQHKYKIYLVVLFYIITVILVISRIFSLIYFVEFYTSRIPCNEVFKADLLDTTATYVKALLGVQQMVSISELSLHVYAELLQMEDTAI